MFKRAAFVFLAVILLAGPGLSADTYVSSPDQGRVLVLDRAGNITGTLGQGGGLQSPYAMAIDSQRNLIVADRASGRLLRYAPDGSSASILVSGIPSPDGLSMNSAGDLFLVSREERNPAATQRRRRRQTDSTDTFLRDVWMVRSGGYTPIKAARIEDSTRLEQTGVLKSGPWAGQILVLSSRPGFVARLERTGAADFHRHPDFARALPGRPTGMTLLPDGRVLVSTDDGRIHQYTSTGEKLLDFTFPVASGPSRLSSTIDGVVHVTRQGSGEILRFDRNGNPLGSFHVGAHLPASAVSSTCVPTPVGQEVSVSPGAGVTVTYDNVTVSGQTCLEVTALDPGVRLTPMDNSIPSFAMKLYEDPGFVVYDLSTTTEFTDSIQVEVDSFNPEAKLLHASGSGNIFADVSVADPRGRVPRFSEFVVYLDTRTPESVVSIKLLRLATLIQTLANEMTFSLFEQLIATVQEISDEVGVFGPDAGVEQAICLTQDLKSLIRSVSGKEISNSYDSGDQNAAGAIFSASASLLFDLLQSLDESSGDLCESQQECSGPDCEALP